MVVVAQEYFSKIEHVKNLLYDYSAKRRDSNNKNNNNNNSPDYLLLKQSQLELTVKGL